MEVGTIVAWRVKEGEAYQPQAIIAEIGTDKANMDAEIFDAGVMLKHLVAEGDEVTPGTPIAIIGRSKDEDIATLLAEYEQRKGAPPSPPPAAARPTVGDDDGSAAAAPTGRVAAPVRPAPEAPRAEAARPAAAQREWMGKRLSTNFADPPGDIRAAHQPGRRAASPLARKVAADRGVDLSRIAGSGPGGRVVRADVEQAAQPKAPDAARSGRPDEIVKHSPMRKTIAKRLLQSHQDVPTFFLTIALDAAGFVAARKQLKRADVKISYNDLLVACVARALRDSPKVNAAWDDRAIVRHGRVDVGIAVALPDGLITPVLREADRMTLTEISTTTRELAARAREGKLKPEEYTGGTFTISNLGMYDIAHFTAILNPPEAAILAVGSIAQVPVVADGVLAVGHRMNVTLTCDHRVVDGATGAEFLQVLRRYVENPMTLLA
jgi:pyruvate dehydrogenase E2 component (dihydrolipoamide acetyltransferase)